MPEKQIENPKGAFGYGSTVAAGQRQGPLHGQTIRQFRNGSQGPIGYGQIVTLAVVGPNMYNSSAGGTSGLLGTTADDSVIVTTVNSQRGIIGIALGSCSSATGLTSLVGFNPRFNGPSSQYINVVTEGPFYGAIVSSAGADPGDILVNTNATVSAGTTAALGGIGGAASTLTVPVLTTESSVSYKIQQLGTVGWFITTGTTVASTLYVATPFTSKAQRANVWVQPSVVAYIQTMTTVS